MTNIDPRDQDMMDSPPTASPTRRTDGWPDDQVEYAAGRNEFREDRTARSAPVNYEPARGDRTPWIDNGEIPTRKVRETKPAFLTTEFWFAVGGIAALIAIYVIEDDPTLDLFRTALLATLIGVSYIVSRGLAKAGSRTTRQPEDPRLAAGYDVR